MKTISALSALLVIVVVSRPTQAVWPPSTALAEETEGVEGSSNHVDGRSRQGPAIQRLQKDTQLLARITSDIQKDVHDALAASGAHEPEEKPVPHPRALR